MITKYIVPLAIVILAMYFNDNTLPVPPIPIQKGGNSVAADQKIQVGGRELDGEAITVDLPNEQHLKNTGGSDGAGLCVFCSLDHDARYHNITVLIGFRDFMTHYPGGGYPEKVDNMIKKLCAEKNQPIPDYIQHTGGDPSFLELSLKTGRYVAVTYAGNDGVYYRSRVAHMVNLVHLSNKWAVIHDNNYPKQYLWLPRSAFIDRWKDMSGGWAVTFFAPPPPPIPTN